MATGPASAIGRYVQEFVGASDAEGLADDQLLERFVARHDEAAFHALLRRHGPMVLGVCRRLLHDPHLADDAFQATFLTLVRRAGAINRQAAVGAWLYGVAFRIAMRAKMRADRQRLREGPMSDVPAPAAGSDIQPDLRPTLDEELNRLPKKYRDPIVLRYLEAKTDEVVASQLCWPLGTVKTRLAKARNLLRDRLTRRGLALTAVALEACLVETASAVVPTVLADATARAAVLTSAGQVAGTAGAQLMTDGVIKEMLRTKLTRMIGASVLALGLLLPGAGWLLTMVWAEKPRAEEQKTADAQRPVPGKVVLPPELDWVPRDVPGFATINVAELWDGTFGQELRRRVPKEKLHDLVDALLGVLRDRSQRYRNTHLAKDHEAVGIDFPNLRRLTFLLAIDLPNPISVAVTTRTPYDRNKVRRAFLPGSWERQHLDRSYYTDEHRTTALYFLDAHTFVLFSDELVEQFLRPKQSEGPLQGAVALAAQVPVVLALNPKPINDLRAERELPEDWLRFGPLFQASAISVGVGPGNELQADCFLSFPGRGSADDGAKALKHVFAFAEEYLADRAKSIAEWQATADRPGGLDNLAKLVKLAQAALKSASPRQEGRRIHVPYRLNVDSTALAAAVTEVVSVAVPMARESTDRVRRSNNLKTLALAMHVYHDAKTKFPAAAIYSKDGKPLLSWRVAILPYLEEDALYNQFKLDEPWDSEHNKTLLARMPRIFAPPGDIKSEPGSTYYQVFNGKGTVFHGKQQRTLGEITNGNGTSTTLLIVEAGDPVPWTKPEDLPFEANKPLPKLGGLSKDEFLAAFADGHVQAISRKTDDKAIRSMIVCNNGLDEKAKKELEQLQGKWTAEVWEPSGQQTAKEELKQRTPRFVFDENELQVTDGEKENQLTVTRIDATSNPKEIDLDDDGNTVLGIYKLEGDTLTLCLGKEQRPTEFKSRKGEPEVMAVLKRVKK